MTETPKPPEIEQVWEQLSPNSKKAASEIATEFGYISFNDGVLDFTFFQNDKLDYNFPDSWQELLTEGLVERISELDDLKDRRQRLRPKVSDFYFQPDIAVMNTPAYKEWSDPTDDLAIEYRWLDGTIRGIESGNYPGRLEKAKEVNRWRLKPDLQQFIESIVEIDNI